MMMRLGMFALFLCVATAAQGQLSGLGSGQLPSGGGGGGKLTSIRDIYKVDPKDSLLALYGPETSLRTTKGLLVASADSAYSQVDTTITHLDRWTVTDSLVMLRQDLGLNGTPSRHLFYLPPEELGLTSGFTGNDIFFPGPEQMPHYDTKSPFTQLDLLLGGENRNYTGVQFSRNITPTWNFWLNFGRITSRRQIGSPRRDDVQALNNHYGFTTHYADEKERFQVMASFYRMMSDVNHTGGEGFETARRNAELRNEAFDSVATFEYQDADRRLENTSARELRYMMNLYQHYRIKPFMVVYFDYLQRFQTNWLFSDLGTDGDVLPRPFPDLQVNEDGTVQVVNDFFVNSQSTFDKSRFREFQQQAGVKGDIKGAFYDLYYRQRQIQTINAFAPSTGLETERYLGGKLRYDYRGFSIKGYGEAGRTDDRDGVGLLYKFGGDVIGQVRGKRLEASFVQMRHRPSSLAQSYVSNHVLWENDFSPQDYTRAEGQLSWNFGTRLRLTPGLSLTNLGSYVYFGRDSLPAQNADAVQIVQPRAKLDLRFLGSMHLEAVGYYSLVESLELNSTADQNIRMPELIADARVYMERWVAGDRLYLSTGVGLHYQSRYFAHGFDPVSQQFFVQDEFPIPAYLATEVFVNAQIKRGLLFVKLRNATQDLIGPGGYWMTPYYSALPRMIDFGVRWVFFD